MSYTKIITEEIKRFLNESYSMENENFKFSQQIQNISFFNYSMFSQDMDVEVLQTNIILNWHFAFWLNDYGVENFIVTVDNVEGNYVLQLLDKLTGEVQQELNKNINDVQWKFVVENASLTAGGTLYVDDVEFDFKTNTCTINFFPSKS